MTTWRQKETAYRAFLRSQDTTPQQHWAAAEADVKRDLAIWRERAIRLVAFLALCGYAFWPAAPGIKVASGFGIQSSVRLHAVGTGCKGQSDGVIVRCNEFFLTAAKPIQ